MKKLPFLLLLLAPPVWAVEHYDPELLNQRAAALAREGEVGTAEILLERAALLAPGDERIARNLKEIRAHQEGMPLPRKAEQEVLPSSRKIQLQLPPLLKTIEPEKAPATGPRAPENAPDIWN